MSGRKRSIPFFQRISDTGPYHDAPGAAGIAGGIWGEERAVHAFATTVAFRTARTSLSAMWRREALTKIKRVLR